MRIDKAAGDSLDRHRRELGWSNTDRFAEKISSAYPISVSGALLRKWISGKGVAADTDRLVQVAYALGSERGAQWLRQVGLPEDADDLANHRIPPLRPDRVPVLPARSPKEIDLDELADTILERVDRRLDERFSKLRDELVAVASAVRDMPGYLKRGGNVVDIGRERRRRRWVGSPGRENLVTEQTAS